MAKQHFLVSPFGPLTIRVHPDHAHIETADPLAGDWGLGWWHGHENGDEAVFARSFWRGELGAEPRPSTGRTELDAFVRQWGFEADLTLETSRLTAGHRARVHAYTQGFNQGRRRRSREAPWTVEDCHLLARTLGFLEWWETRAPQMEFLLSAWQEGLSWARVLDLWPGLGTEPDKATWKSLRFPSFSPEAWAFLDKLRRFRTAPAWIVPANRSASGFPLLGAGYISDVTEAGLPFSAVRIDTLSGKVRGLSRPGHPGFLSGRTASLAWHAVPAVDDSIDLRIHEREGGALAGKWAGSGRVGTLESLLAFESSTSAGQARDRTMGLGSACLDVTAVDAAEGLRWALGPRWLRATPRDAWLPAPWGIEAPVGERSQPAGFEEIPNRATAQTLETQLSQTKSRLPEASLPALRFLLPDTEAGRGLRRWTGTPETGTEQQDFERLYGAVLEAFWESCPRAPRPESPLAQTLATLVDKLILAPHSAWFPSQEKNQRLAEAVRRAFAPGQPPGPSLLTRRAPKALWVEAHGGRSRVFASTVAVVTDIGESGWRVFLSDDESEAPAFNAW